MHQPSVAAYVDAQQGWLYGYTNFNSVKFSTSPAVEVTVAAGIRPTLGPFEFDIGAAYYYYPGEQGPDLSNYWEAHATLSHKVTDKLSWGPTIAYAPDVWQTGAWGVYAAGTGPAASQLDSIGRFRFLMGVCRSVAVRAE